MRRMLFFPLFTILFLSSQFGNAQNLWRPRACLPSTLRINAATFSIGDIGYVVGGSTLSGTINEVWAYDELNNTWTQKNNFPISVSGASAFVINGVAYAGLGLDGSGTYHQEFWVYDDANDQWTPIANYTGAARSLAMAFVINGKGYLGCGKGAAVYNDLYEYNPIANAWAIKAVLPGGPRHEGFSIAGGSVGYFGGGRNGASVYIDAYRYDPTIDTWSQIANFAGLARYDVACFSLNGEMYVAGGKDNANYYDECWHYDASGNSWVQQPGFSCVQQPEATINAFTINGHGFITCGMLANGNYTNDLLEFGLADDRFVNTYNILGSDTSICGNFSLTLSTGNVCTAWSNGASGAQITVTAPGTYAATWPGTCEMRTDTIVISTGPPLPFNLGTDTVYCGSFTRTLNSGNANTVWSTGVTGPQITVNSPATYTATATNSCGSTVKSIVIGQGTAPVIDLGADTLLCAGQTLLLDATVPNSTYRWQDNSANATYNVTIAGIYSVSVSNNGCTGSDTISVQYSQGIPQIDLGADQTVCDPNGIILNIPVANAHFVWNDNSTDSFYHVSSSGVYAVTVTTGCGSVTDAVKLEIHTDQCVLLVPSAFSPNEDGVNDAFRTISHCPVQTYSISIYNRWGELVFKGSNIEDYWDGTFKNQSAEMGVYVYYIEYFNYCEGRLKKVVGNVTLLR